MPVGDIIQADRIQGRLTILDSDEDLQWVEDVFGVRGFPYVVLSGFHESNPDAIYGVRENHYQAPAELVYLNPNS